MAREGRERFSTGVVLELCGYFPLATHPDQTRATPGMWRIGIEYSLLAAVWLPGVLSRFRWRWGLFMRS